MMLCSVFEFGIDRSIDPNHTPVHMSIENSSVHHASTQAGMASEAGDEEASASAASVASGSDDGEKSSHGSVQATGADDDVVEAEDKPRAASEEAGQQQQEQQKQLPDGWLAHSICGKLYDGNLYEEITGGRPGQDPSTVNAYAVFGKVDKKPKCLVCVHSGSSTHAHNYLGHLRKHKEFVEYEASLGKGESKEGGKGNGAGGACTCGGGGTFKWSEERKARVRRLLICMIVVHGRCVLCLMRGSRRA